MPWTYTSANEVPEEVAAKILALFLAGNDIVWISCATRISGNAVNEIIRRVLKAAQ